MKKRLEYDISRVDPHAKGEGIRRKSELDVRGKRELAGDLKDIVRIPIQHGRVDDVMPAWVVGDTASKV